jgi:hypothetical protein
MPANRIMPRTGVWMVFPLLTLTVILLAMLLGACSNADDKPVYVTPGDIPSPTPFQPEVGPFDSPFDPTSEPLIPMATDTNGVPLEGSLSPTPTSTVPDFPILNLSVDINPLTGLPPADPILLERRPLAIKISNYPRAIRPQFGLTRADQVFEYYIEAGDTRFIGIFYGQDASQVGPVRSGRYFDEHITRMYHAFYVFNFADPRELDYFRKSDLASFLVTPGCPSCTCPPFFVYNPNKLADENHLATYFDTTRFYECNAKKGVNNSRQPIRNGFFSVLIPNSDNTVNRIYTKYSPDDYHYWEYDPGTLKYLRFQETVTLTEGVTEAYAPLIDALTNQQVNAENVVTLFVQHTFANQFDAADEVYQIGLTGSGKAYVFRDGIAVPGKWYRAAEDQPLFLTTVSGSPIYLRPGRTFYEVIGASSTTYQDDSGWYFAFRTP